MKLTPNLKTFAATNFVSSVAFFYLLDQTIDAKAWTQIWVLAIGYGVVWFMSGLLLGKADNARNYRGNLGLMYHLVTTVIMTVTSIGAAFLLEHQEVSDTLWVVGSANLSLLVHWLTTKDSPKGVNKKEAFK